MNDGRPAKTPVGQADFFFLLNVALPNDFSRGRLKAKQIAPATEDKNAIEINGGSAGHAAFVIFVAEFGRVGIFPQTFSSQRLETINRVHFIGMAESKEPAISDDHRRETETRSTIPK